MKVTFKPKKKPKKAKKPLKRSRKDSGYKKVYLEYFGFKDQSECFCEIPHCGRIAVDVFFIEGESINIENRIALCKTHECEFLGVKKWIEFLNITHEKFMKKNKCVKTLADV